mmetsp:Transcript_14583/g.34928  ORF Transcript_14583/g.34928 Transcript_14583/m.34928 type:complete len:127 (+) Transcript_14583:1483-1863(+)
MTSKWLVGSSRRRISAFRSMARARASFMRHPPERVDTAWSGLALPSSVKPTVARTLRTSSLGMFMAWIFSSAKTYSTQDKCDCSPWISASTKTVRTSLVSGKPSTWLLAMARMRVVLPESLPPRRP